MADALDFEQLKNAKRKDLQTLAKKYGIKANLAVCKIITGQLIMYKFKF